MRIFHNKIFQVFGGILLIIGIIAVFIALANAPHNSENFDNAALVGTFQNPATIPNNVEIVDPKVTEVGKIGINTLMMIQSDWDPVNR